MQQIDNLNELPKEKRPPEDIIWDGTSEEMDEWLNKVLSSKGDDGSLKLSIKDIEG